MKSTVAPFLIVCWWTWMAEGWHVYNHFLRRDEDRMARQFWHCCRHQERQHHGQVCAENSCYFFLEGDMTWREARRRCQDSYGHSDMAFFDIVTQKEVIEKIKEEIQSKRHHDRHRRDYDWKAWIGFMKPDTKKDLSTDYFTLGAPYVDDRSLEESSTLQRSTRGGPYYGWMHYVYNGLKYALAGGGDRIPNTACNFTIPKDLYRRCFSEDHELLCGQGGKCTRYGWRGHVLPPTPIGEVLRIPCPDGRSEEYYQCYPRNSWRRVNGSCYDHWGADILEDLKDNSSDARDLATAVYKYVTLTREVGQESQVPVRKEQDTRLSLGAVIDVVQKIVDLGHKQAANYTPEEALNFTEHVISTLSVIMDSDQSQEWENITKDEQSRLASRIILETERTAQLLACSQVDTLSNQSDNHFIVRGKNIELQTFVFSGSQSVTCFPSCDASDTASIRIAGDVPWEDIPEACDNTAYVGFGTVYRGLGSRLSPTSTGSSRVGKLPQAGRVVTLENTVVNSEVVGFSFGALGTSIQFPDKAVVAILPHLNTSIKKPATCAFWNFSKNGGAGEWDSNGCEVDASSSSNLQTTCRCNHLTNFAILMDMTGEMKDTPALTTLTIVCSVLSIICLMMTIASLICLRALHCRRSTIACNVSFCLIVSNLIMLTGFRQTQSFGVTCLAVRSVLLYVLLAAFMWMLLEGFHLYRMLVIVFNHDSIPVVWFYLFGYGIPLAVTATATCLTRGHYRQNFCWFVSEDIFYFCGPMIVVIAVNLVLLTVALSAASNVKVKTKLRTPERIGTWLKGSASLVFLLGITWVIGLPLLAGNVVPYVEYIFTFINGSQGVTMFIFHIVWNEKARTVLLKVFERNSLGSPFDKPFKKREKKRKHKNSLGFGSQTSTRSTQLNSISSSLSERPPAGHSNARMCQR